MKRGRSWIIPFVLVCLHGLASAAEPAPEALTASRLPDLPPATDGTQALGVAGAFAGEHNGALIVAGGANFPQGWPNTREGEPAPKIYHRDVYVLTPGAQEGDDPEWRVFPDVLREGYSYGVSIPTEHGLICIGGEWKDPAFALGAEGEPEQRRHVFDAVFLLQWDGEHVAMTTDFPDGEPLPSLPEGVSFAAGAKAGATIVVAGGYDAANEPTHTCWAMALDKRPLAWHPAPPWPGEARAKAVAAAQSDGASDCFYLFSGQGPHGEYFTDAYCFNVSAWSASTTSPPDGFWHTIADVGAGAPGVRPVAAGCAAACGVNHILVVSGADGAFYRDHPDRPATEHPGFRTEVLAYHTITDTWHHVLDLPGAEDPIRGGLCGVSVTTNLVPWNGALVIPSGEIRPGVRTPAVWQLSTRVPSRFGALNWSIVGVYFLALLAMGVYFAGREKTTDDFFKAGCRIPWWAAGLSIYGTTLSAITFMAIPAKLYATDWRYVLTVFTLLLVIPVVTRVFIPFYRRLNVTTAYEYLEQRFHVVVRLFASVAFLIMQFGRLGIVLFLPSAALSVVTGIDVYLCIAVMGLLATAYTVLGGMEAVVWTDVLQVIVLMGGVVISLALILFSIPGGLLALMADAHAYGKLDWCDTSLDFTTATIWVILLAIPGGLVTYTSDQAVIQRYLTTRDERAASRGLWGAALLGIVALVFWAVGTALWSYYRAFPERLVPTLGKPEMIFPWFIVSQLPRGVAGLVIAGIFAASMSSLDSSMNSMSAAVVTDFYRRFTRRVDEPRCLRLAKIVTALVGFTSTLFAMAMATWDIKSIWDGYIAIVGLFGGGLTGVFLLGMGSRRAHTFGAMAGLLASSVILYALQRHTNVHPYVYAPLGIVSCVAVGWIVSAATPSARRSVAGLTIHTLAQAGNQDTPAVSGR